jgi:hypothetical protein
MSREEEGRIRRLEFPTAKSHRHPGSTIKAMPVSATAEGFTRRSIEFKFEGTNPRT